MVFSPLSVPKDISPLLFRAYDIRGSTCTHLTPEAAYAIGLAIGSEARHRDCSTLVIGRDARLSSPILIHAVIQGLLETGCSLIDIGIVPTPVLYFATHFLGIYSGVMLTASHNPSDDNGFKIVLKNETLCEGHIKNLYDRIRKHDFMAGQGELTLYPSICEQYIQHVQEDIVLRKPLKVVLDAGNGVAGAIAPLLFRALGCEVIPLFCELDGRFPNHHPDPSVVKNLAALQETVLQQNAAVGLAFDGDGDRLGVVTDKGEIIWPDRLLMLFAERVLREHPKSPILFDVKCTRYLEKLITKQGGYPIIWKTGHSFIKSKLKELNAPLAGEMSGHLFFKDRWYGFDDGLYAGARLLEILSQENCSMTHLFSAFSVGVSTPELKIAMEDTQKTVFMKALMEKATFDGGKLNTIDGLRVEFKRGWGLVRASNTTACLTVRFEADSSPDLETIQQIFRTALLGIEPHLALPW